jgi:protein disulfide-isomerase A6
MFSKASAPLLAAVLLDLLVGAEASLYTSKSPVLQVDAKSYDRLIARSNHASVSQSCPALTVLMARY